MVEPRVDPGQHLLNALPLASGVQIQQISPTALAYLGDAVYELYIRTYYLLPRKRAHDYHQQVVSQVRAEAQAACSRSLQPHLSEVELAILKQGRNAALKGSRRVHLATYQQATGFEALIGHLYLTNPQRLAQLFQLLKFDRL